MKLYADIKLIEKSKKDFEKYNDKQFKKIYSNFNLQDSGDFWFDQPFNKRIKNKGKINFEKITYYLNNLPTNFTNTNKIENKKIIKSQEKESNLKEKYDIPKNLKYVTYKSNVNKSNQIYKSNSKEKIKNSSKNENNKQKNNNYTNHNNIIFNKKNLLINQTNKKLLFSKTNSNNSILLFSDNPIKKSNINILKNIPLNYYYEINNNKKKIYKTSNSQTNLINSKIKKKKNRKNSNSITIKLTKLFEKNLTKTRNTSISKSDLNPIFTPPLIQNSLKIVEKIKSNNETISKNKRISQTFNEPFYDKSKKINNIKKLSQRLNETKLNNKKEKENEKENQIETSFNNNNESIKKENKKKLKRNYSTPIFEQQMEWKARVNLKIKQEQLKSELNEMKNCPFYPKISQIKDLNNTNSNYSESNNIYIKQRRERIKIKNNLEDEKKNKRTKPLLLSLRGYEKNKGWIYPNNDLNKSLIYQKIRSQSVKIKGNNQNSFEKIVKAIFSN